MEWNRLKEWFRKTFSRTSRDSSVFLSRHVEPHEPITRFIHFSGHFSQQTKRVRTSALEPMMNSKVGRLETSVFRALDANSHEMWAICSAYVDAAGRLMKARATCRAEVILKEGLLFRLC